MVDQELRDEIATLLAPISPGYLRTLLRHSGLPLTPLVEGVRQDSLEHLERTLVGLAREYEQARQTGSRKRMRECRQAVIQAKDHARLAMRRVPASGPDRQEMIQWMLVWLDNPGLFPTWLRLRRQALTESRATPPE